MWAFVKKLVAKSKTLNHVFGDVVFETPEVHGDSSRSFFQWRIKKGMDGGHYFIALKMRPDAFVGSRGSPTNYMNFDIETAQRVRFDLDRCISEYYRLAGEKRPLSKT
jgi:hypothetical protein